MAAMMPRRVRSLTMGRILARAWSAGGGQPGALRDAMEERRIGPAGEHPQLGGGDQAERHLPPIGGSVRTPQGHGADVLRHLAHHEAVPGANAVLLEEREQARVLLRLLRDA